MEFFLPGDRVGSDIRAGICKIVHQWTDNLHGKEGIPGDSAKYEGLRTVQLCYRWRMVKNRI